MQDLEDILRLSEGGRFADAEVLRCFRAVKDLGDVFVIKADGQRDHNYYTVFILLTGKKHDMLRDDSSDLGKSVYRVFKKYFEYKKSLNH